MGDINWELIALWMGNNETIWKTQNVSRKETFGQKLTDCQQRQKIINRLKMSHF